MNTTVANLWGQGKVKTVQFDEKHLTSFSGAKPFVTYLRKVGLPAFCDGPLGLDKRVRLYTISQLVLLMVTAIVVGVERLSQVRLFAGDAVVRRVLKLPRLPVHKTLFGLLRRFDEAACERLSAFSRAEVVRHLRRSQRKSLLVDLDSTVVTVYGSQEGAAVGYNPHKGGRKSYHPLLCIVGRWALMGQLRPGNTHPGSGAGPFLQRCLEALGELARSRLIVRADAAWCSEAVFSRLEAEGASYIIVARATAAVKRKLVAKAHWRTLEGGIQVGSFHLALDGWSRTRRLCAVRTPVAEGASPQGKLFDESGYTYQLLVTDLAHPAERVWRLYNGRANAENVIKELKGGFNLDKPPTGSWRANEAYLQLCLVAYNLYVGYLRELYAPGGRVHWTVQTMRLVHFHVAGRWVKRARRWIIKINRSFAFKRDFMLCERRLLRLRI